MSQKVVLAVPEAPPPPLTTLPPLRPLHAHALRLGVLDNSKGNADHLLAMIVEGVQSALPVASVVSVRKLGAGMPAPDDLLDRLTCEADCVVSAMAD